MQAWTDAEVEAKCRTMQTAILSSQLSTLREETDILRVEHVRLRQYYVMIVIDSSLMSYVTCLQNNQEFKNVQI